MVEEVQRHSVHTLVFRSLKRTHDMFLSDEANLPETDEASESMRAKCKVLSEYRPVLQAVRESNKDKKPQLALPSSQPLAGQQITPSGYSGRLPGQLMITGGPDSSSSIASIPGSFDFAGFAATSQSFAHSGDSNPSISGQAGIDNSTRSLLPTKKITAPKAKWHPPWKLYRVISGHTGWVRCVDVEPANQWFATGAADRMVKIWDLATGTLKLSLTGHVSAVRAVKISDRHPYMFSAGEDKQVKCWDLEYNKVIRHYHGHLSACTSLALHPTLDVLLSTGRDCVVRVWDMRTKAQIHSLVGHTNTTASVQTQAAEPQVISGSHDSTIRMWDLSEGRSVGTLTNHKKSVRAVVIHPELYMFASASPDNIKQWKGSKGEFVRNLGGHNAIINSLAVNRDNVLVSGGDNGSMNFWDWTSGHCFQKTMSKAQSGSIDSEAGIFAMTFDQSGSRLLTGEADKTIKCYKEDEDATEETHPVIQRPELSKKSRY